MSERQNLNINLKGPTPPLGIEIEKIGKTVVMYVRVVDSKVARTKEIESDVLADYDAEGRLVGFEVVGMKPGMSASVLNRIKARYSEEVPSLELLDELLLPT